MSRKILIYQMFWKGHSLLFSLIYLKQTGFPAPGVIKSLDCMLRDNKKRSEVFLVVNFFGLKILNNEKRGGVDSDIIREVWL